MAKIAKIKAASSAAAPAAPAAPGAPAAPPAPKTVTYSYSNSIGKNIKAIQNPTVAPGTVKSCVSISKSITNGLTYERKLFHLVIFILNENHIFCIIQFLRRIILTFC